MREFNAGSEYIYFATQYPSHRATLCSLAINPQHFHHSAIISRNSNVRQSSLTIKASQLSLWFTLNTRIQPQPLQTYSFTVKYKTGGKNNCKQQQSARISTLELNNFMLSCSILVPCRFDLVEHRYIYLFNQKWVGNQKINSCRHQTQLLYMNELHSRLQQHT